MSTIVKNQKDIYQEITDYVIEALENGNVMWQQSWRTPGGGLPKNLTTEKKYTGWNMFFLYFICQKFQFGSPYFVTFKQARKLGGYVKEGGKGFPIIRWVKKDRTEIEHDAETGTDRLITKSRLYPVRHIVFNVTQTANIKYPVTETTILNEDQKIAACEAVIDRMPMPPAISYEGYSPYYIPETDHIVMPPFASFVSPEEFYCTVFHEMVHATGHAKRLDRKEMIDYEASRYNHCTEEMIAELGSAFICAATGIDGAVIDNSAAYINGWLQKLKEDKTLIVKAAAKAQAAADFILGTKAFEENEAADNEE